MWRLIGGYCPTFHLVISLTVLSSRAYAFNKCSYVRRSPASTFQSYHFRPTKCTYLSTRISTWGMYSQVWNNSSVSPYSTYSAHLFFFLEQRGLLLPLLSLILHVIFLQNCCNSILLLQSLKVLLRRASIPVFVNEGIFNRNFIVNR